MSIKLLPKPRRAARPLFLIGVVVIGAFMPSGKVWATHETPPGLKFTCKPVPKGAILDVRDWRYLVVDEDHRPRLNENGKQVEHRVGFRAHDGLRFKDALRECMKTHKAIRRVDFTSNGGAVSAAFEIAQTIAEHGFHTHVPAGSQCVSACTLAFLGGFRRTVDLQGTYEVHSFSSYGGEGAERFSEQVLDLLLTMSKGLKKPEDISDEKVREAVKAIQDFEASLERMTKNPLAVSYMRKTLADHFRSQLTEIQRSSALLARNWMQTVQERRVSARLMDHVFATTIMGVRPLTREELKDLSVITDEAPVTD